MSEMGTLYQLIPPKKLKSKPVPIDILTETKIAARVLSNWSSVNNPGNQVPFNCSGCGGILWQVDKNSSLRFSCHNGPAYTTASLLAEHTKMIEETMWSALQMFKGLKTC